MSSYTAALWAEGLKACRSRIAWLTALGFSLASLVGGLFMIILKDPERARRLGLIGAKAQITAGSADWPAYLELLAQTSAIGGIFVFGFVVTWVFGREYSDRTAKDLLALPTPRWAIVGAKFTVVGLWCVVLAAMVYVLGLGVGAAIGLPQWSSELVLHATGIFTATSGLTIALSTPIGFVASAGRGYLPPLAFVVLALALAQVLAVMGWGGYFPWSVPALLSEMAGTSAEHLNSGSYVIVALTSLAGLSATFIWWQMADQTR